MSTYQEYIHQKLKNLRIQEESTKKEKEIILLQNLSLKVVQEEITKENSQPHIFFQNTPKKKTKPRDAQSAFMKAIYGD